MFSAVQLIRLFCYTIVGGAVLGPQVYKEKPHQVNSASRFERTGYIYEWVMASTIRAKSPDVTLHS